MRIAFTKLTFGQISHGVPGGARMIAHKPRGDPVDLPEGEVESSRARIHSAITMTRTASARSVCVKGCTNP
jgi:hypothetical protein